MQDAPCHDQSKIPQSQSQSRSRLRFRYYRKTNPATGQTELMMHTANTRSNYKQGDVRGKRQWQLHWHFDRGNCSSSEPRGARNPSRIRPGCQTETWPFTGEAIDCHCLILSLGFVVSLIFVGSISTEWMGDLLDFAQPPANPPHKLCPLPISAFYLGAPPIKVLGRQQKSDAFAFRDCKQFCRWPITLSQ